MPRKLRLVPSEATTAICRKPATTVYKRGNYRRPIFAMPGAADAFQACLDETCIAFGWLMHAFNW